MSLEQPIYTYEQAPLTPTRTPTSPAFDASFQTPKFESSFYDPRVTWNTADPNCSPNLLRTPKPISFETPRPERISGTFGQPHGTQGDHIGGSKSAATVPATPDGQRNTFPQSPGIGYTPNFNTNDHVGIGSPLILDTSTSFRSAGSIQTPPPTTTSAAKQKGRKKKAPAPQQKSQPAKSASNRRMSAPLAPRPSENNGETVTNVEELQLPPQFAPLDFSPDVLGYNFGGPATAPAYPQQKLFWDSDAHAAANLDFGQDLTNSYDPFAHGTTDPFDTQDVNFDFTNNDPTAVASFAQPSTNHAAGQRSDANNFPGPAHNGVDPSLLFSSPAKLPEPMPGLNAQPRVLTEESLQPYAYQVQEAKREKSYGGVSKARKRRKPSVDSPAVTAALETLRGDPDRQPAVKRSMTDSFIPGAIRASSSSRPGSMHGRSSPLKRVRESSRRSSSRAPSVSLTIDGSGRARLIGAPDNDNNDDARVIDSQSNDDSATSCSSDSDGPEDMVTSFAPRLPKLGRFSSSASHSQKSSNTSMYSDHQPALPELKQRPATSGPSTNATRYHASPALKPLREATSMEEDPDSEAETVLDPDDGDFNATSELKKVMKSRDTSLARKPRHHVYSPHSKHNASFAGQNNMFLDTLSPTTMTDPDLATPTSGTSSNASDGIRCICNVSRDDGQMIQCESCRKWLHVPCTGLNPQRLPNIYLCLFCTGSTPTVRGGRVRDPSRKSQYGPNSPLGQKAPRFR